MQILLQLKSGLVSASIAVIARCILRLEEQKKGPLEQKNFVLCLMISTQNFYNTIQNKTSCAYHTYVMNDFLTAYPLCKAKYFRSL